MTNNDYRNMKLSLSHKEMLTASATAPDVAEKRGYRTVTIKADLKLLGFGINQQNVPTLLIPIHGVNGEIALYHHRPDSPRIRDGKPVKYEFPSGSHMAIDVHPLILKNVRDPNIPLFITEGVKKADAAISIGLCCIALIGTWNWRGTNEYDGKTALPDWDSIALKNSRDEPRQVYICYDSDVMIKPQVNQALTRLSAFLEQRGASVAYIYLPHGNGAVKTGLDDFLAAGNTRDDLLKLATKELRSPVNSNGNGADDKNATVAEKLLRLTSDVVLFHNERAENYAWFKAGDHRELWPIRSSAFRQWLAREFYNKYGRPCVSQAIDEALSVLEGKARYEGEFREFSVRCVYDGNRSDIWLDICDSKWRAIHVTNSSWRIDDNPPALFRRYASHESFIEPDTRASIQDIELLREYMNIRSENTWRLLIAWMIAAWIPNIAHPPLIIHGEQGTAKSTLLKIVGMLIDPSQTPLRSEPSDLKQWTQIADHSWFIALDNVSKLPAWLSDAMCRAVTGDSYSTRKLYTDNEDMIISFRRVLALTGIEMVATRSDLLDRSILVGLEPIPPKRRRPEIQVLSDFNAIRPKLFGALLSLLQNVIAEIPYIKTDNQALPRMADFAKIGIAVEHIMRWPESSFLLAYQEGIREQNEEALSAYLISEPIKTLAKCPWNGTAQELLKALGEIAGEKNCSRTEWPKTAKSLSNQLRRIAPNLRGDGINVSFSRNSKQRTITITNDNLSVNAIRDFVISDDCDGSDAKKLIDSVEGMREVLI